MLHLRHSARYLTWLERLRANYWLVPAIMSLLAIGAALLALHFDREYATQLARIRWFYSGGADGARGLLSTIGGSAITVAGIVFSMNIVALTMASAQFGPRLLRNFVRDPGNQVTLGIFTATYLYSLLILREVKGSSDVGPAFVPQLAVTGAVALGTAGLGVLIYFVHHVAISIQAPIVAAKLGLELEEAIKSEFPVRLEKNVMRNSMEAQLSEYSMPDFTQNTSQIPASRSGYLQAVDFRRLLRLSQDFDLIVKLHQRPGEFVIEGTPILTVVPNQNITSRLTEDIEACFSIGRTRNAAQDIEFIVHQLSELALRALSPSINDPYTAMNCIDWLGAGMEEMLWRDYPKGFLLDKDEQLRVIWHPTTHKGVLNAAFHLIRQYSRGVPSVTIRLLEILARLALVSKDEADQDAVKTHADMIWRAAQLSIHEPNDLEDTKKRYDNVIAALASAESLRD